MRPERAEPNLAKAHALRPDTLMQTSTLANITLADGRPIRFFVPLRVAVGLEEGIRWRRSHCYAHTQGCEACGKPLFDAAPPADLFPWMPGEQLLGSDRLAVGDVVLSGRSCPETGRSSQIHHLPAGYGDGRRQAALAQCLAERRTHPKAGIGQHAAEAHACGPNPVDLLDGDLRLVQGDLPGPRAPSPSPYAPHRRSSFRAGTAAAPPSPAPRAMPGSPTPAPAVRVLAERRGVLRRDPDRVATFFGIAVSSITRKAPAPTTSR